MTNSDLIRNINKLIEAGTADFILIFIDLFQFKMNQTLFCLGLSVVMSVFSALRIDNSALILDPAAGH